MIKVDLHTHSEASKDGGITAEQYATLLSSEVLDYIAVTDHNRIDFALGLKKALGERIIVGEEISTAEGELIGLFLREFIPDGLSLEETIDAIRAQNAIVYIPHPFETIRKGIPEDALERIVTNVDIIEVYNGRAFMQNKSKQALIFAQKHRLASAASSDAHSKSGVGKTYCSLQEAPSVGSLEQQLLTPHLVYKRSSIGALLAPKRHRLSKTIRGYKV